MSNCDDMWWRKKCKWDISGFDIYCNIFFVIRTKVFNIYHTLLCASL